MTPGVIVEKGGNSGMPVPNAGVTIGSAKSSGVQRTSRGSSQIQETLDMGFTKMKVGNVAKWSKCTAPEKERAAKRGICTKVQRSSSTLGEAAT